MKGKITKYYLKDCNGKKYCITINDTLSSTTTTTTTCAPFSCKVINDLQIDPVAGTGVTITELVVNGVSTIFLPPIPNEGSSVVEICQTSLYSIRVYFDTSASGNLPLLEVATRIKVENDDTSESHIGFTGINYIDILCPINNPTGSFTTITLDIT